MIEKNKNALDMSVVDADYISVKHFDGTYAQWSRADVEALAFITGQYGAVYVNRQGLCLSWSDEDSRKALELMHAKAPPTPQAPAPPAPKFKVGDWVRPRASGPTGGYPCLVRRIVGDGSLELQFLFAEDTFRLFPFELDPWVPRAGDWFECSSSGCSGKKFRCLLVDSPRNYVRSDKSPTGESMEKGRVHSLHDCRPCLPPSDAPAQALFQGKAWDLAWDVGAHRVDDLTSALATRTEELRDAILEINKRRTP
jgi:hypothetical protein